MLREMKSKVALAIFTVAFPLQAAAEVTCPAVGTAVLGNMDVFIDLKNDSGSGGEAPMLGRRSDFSGSSPWRSEGVLLYNRDTKTMQFCNGDGQWTEMTGGGAGGETTPTNQSCGNQNLGWGGFCSASTGSGSHGAKKKIEDTLPSYHPYNNPAECWSAYTGFANITCSNGVWVVTGSASCSQKKGKCK